MTVFYSSLFLQTLDHIWLDLKAFFLSFGVIWCQGHPGKKIAVNKCPAQKQSDRICTSIHELHIGGMLINLSLLWHCIQEKASFKREKTFPPTVSEVCSMLVPLFQPVGGLCGCLPPGGQEIDLNQLSSSSALFHLVPPPIGRYESHPEQIFLRLPSYMPITSGHALIDTLRSVLY